jgi:hypothetical protein
VDPVYCGTMSGNQEDASAGPETHEVVGHTISIESALIDSRTPIASESNAFSEVTGDGSTTAASRTNLRPWDFSNRKVTVQGVDKFHDVKTATKMVQKWLEIKPEAQIQFTIDKIKKPPKSTWMTITLQSESMVQPFIDYINSNSIRNRKGNKIFAKLQTSSMDHDRKRAHSGDGSDVAFDNTDEAQSKRPRREGSANESDDASLARRPIHVDELKDRIIPLWKLSSDEQLQWKMKEMIKKCAMKIINEIKSKFRYRKEKGFSSSLIAYFLSTCLLTFSISLRTQIP